MPPRPKPKPAPRGRKASKSADPPLRLEWRSPAELAENPANWRRHPDLQTRALSDLIGEVGWAGACLVNERTGVMLDGHARKKIALDRGEALVPVLVGSWTPEQERLILATLDPVAGLAVADPAALTALLSGLDVQSEAVSLMLQELVGATVSPDAAVNDPGGGGDSFDPQPAEAGPTRAQLGDLWVLGRRHRLLVGDCTKPENVTRLFGGAVPDIMTTDPPYGVSYDPSWRHRAGANVSKRLGKVLNDDRADWTDAWRLFPGNVAYVWHGALHGRTVFDSLVSAGFQVRAQLVWVKPRLVLGRGDFHWRHEPALVAEKPGGCMGEKPTQAAPGNHHDHRDGSPAQQSDGADREGELGYYAVRNGSRADWRGGRKQTTVWEIGFAGETKTFHGTQKPLECMARAMRNHGGTTVYDPFLGSGTTLIAAHRLGRSCLGFELDPAYADVILKRAEAEGMTVEKGR